MSAILSLIPTQDGSLTLFDPITGESFHNQEGAFTEALSHFVVPSHLQARFDAGDTVRVLDVCFGLGYNSLALVCASLALLSDAPFTGKSLVFYIVENDLDVLTHTASVVQQVPQFESLRQQFPDFSKRFLHAVKTNGMSYSQPLVFESPELSLTFVWLKDDQRNTDLHSVFSFLNTQSEDFQTRFDLIFYDPFSPATMSELWTAELFETCAHLLNERGALMTYSSAGSVRGGLMEAGFHIMKSERLGERSGGTVAVKDHDSGLPYVNALVLDDLEAEFLTTTATIPFRNKQNRLSSEQMIRNRRAEQDASTRPASEPLRQKIRKAKRDYREANPTP